MQCGNSKTSAVIRGIGGSKIFVLLAAAVACGGAVWRYQFAGGESAARKSVGEESRRADSAVSVRVATARLADVPVAIDAVGTVQAMNMVTVRTQVDGQLMKLAFVEGQEVKKGDVLAQIDPSLYQAQYDQAIAKKAQDEANLLNARLDLTRYERLIAGNFASKQQYSTQKALVTQLEAQVRADAAAMNSAKTTLDFSTIRSMIDGRVGIRLVDAGNILHTIDQTGIVVITQLKPIYVIFTLPQQALPVLKKAEATENAVVKALGPDNVSVIETGQLTVIDNQIDQLTGTVRVKSTFANQDGGLWPGQFVNVRVVVDTLKQATIVPSQAIQRGPNGAFLYAVGEDNVAVMKQVTTGSQDQTQAVVTSGIAPDTRVIISGFPSLSSGSKVKIEQAASDIKERRKEAAGNEKSSKEERRPPGAADAEAKK